MIDPVFLDLDRVVALHDEMVSDYGGLAGVRDQGLLLSALDRARNKHAYSDPQAIDLFDLAAAYAFGIAKNHPFNDGNKRTCWAACLTFLDVNGVLLPERLDEAVEVIVRLAEDELDEAAFAAWLRRLAG